MINSSDIRLVQTCVACPEQYDAYYEDNYVGYLRLRHGRFSVEDKDGNLILEAHPEGDGIFINEERDSYLQAAKEAIVESLINNPKDWTDKRIVEELQSESKINRIRHIISTTAGRLEQAALQRNPISPIEARKIEFEAAHEIMQILEEDSITWEDDCECS